MTNKRNRITFGLGTIGRDMVYSMISMYLIFFLTDVIELPTSTLWWITGIILFARIFDALNDPFMGLIVDNTRTRFGKFKPWIFIGALLSGVFTIALFSNIELTGAIYIIVFGLLYLAWGITFTANDISYWSMLPALSLNQKEREKIGSFARICANIGLFFVVAGIIPITGMIESILDESNPTLNNGPRSFFLFTCLTVLIMWIGQAITLLGVKEPRNVVKKENHTSIKELVSTIFKNDQLLYTGISMALFMIGYVTTTGFGLYYFKYAYGNEGMYSIFAVVLGLSQITALIIFPLFSKKFTRKQLYFAATILVVVGYIIFFFAPTSTFTYIAIAGILIFVGEAFIQLMMLMFLADSVEYGHLKSGKRNESITFSIQPFINKMGGAVASGITGAVVILSGIKDANTAADVTTEGLLLMKIAMFVFPLICILICFFVYLKKYKIDENMYQDIIEKLKERGDLVE